MKIHPRLFSQPGISTATSGEETDPTQTNVPVAPPEVFRQQKWIFQHIAVLMRTYGMAKIAYTVQAAGVMPIDTIGFAPMDEEHLPDALKLRRPNIVRALRYICATYCISSFSIELSTAETAELHQYWEYLRTGDTTAADAERYQDVELQYEKDPKPGETVGASDEQTADSESGKSEKLFPDE